jgi:hypothetical protein
MQLALAAIATTAPRQQQVTVAAASLEKKNLLLKNKKVYGEFLSPFETSNRKNRNVFKSTGRSSSSFLG